MSAAPPPLILLSSTRPTILSRRAEGVSLHELEIPHGPLASFRAPGGQRLAVYELTRPHAADHFAGRVDD